MVTASRGCTRAHVVARPRRDSQAFVETVSAAVREGQYDIVFGGGDDWMAALAAYRDQVPAVVAHAPYRAIQLALDKVALGHEARKVGLASPLTVVADPPTLQRWHGPVVVKCRSHWSPGQTRPHRIDTRQFESVDEARDQVAHITAAGADPVLQEPIEGGLSALVGVFHDGRLVGRVQQQTSRLWPTPSGMSTRAQTVPVDADLVTKAEKLLTNIGWRGLVELQFLTGAEGEPHLIDLNGRFYGSLALAEFARPGIVDAWGQLALGRPISPLPDGDVGRRYAWWAGDFRRARLERRGTLTKDVVDTIGWGWGARHSVWDLRDLGPTRRLVLERLAPGRTQRATSEAPSKELTELGTAAPPASATHAYPSTTVPRPAVSPPAPSTTPEHGQQRKGPASEVA